MELKYYAGKDVPDALLDCMERISKQDGVDVVEVVRCKDCIYSRFDLDMSGKAAPWLLCKNLRDGMLPLMVAKTDYCCWAERKEDEDGQLQDQD